jgi:histidyl-tRNA synthetase
MIKPRTLKGFRDYLPEAMIPRERLMETARNVYRSYGFAPIDTPALELDEILGGKGGDETEKQRYRFEDHGKRMVGMRFDLTVPLARFAAQHIQELGTPFKRYHIAPVWRGENPQAGRYREFMQCDFDTIGTTSIVSDIETALVIHDLMRALGFEDFVIRINNRKVLNGMLQTQGLDEHVGRVLRALDKLGKLTPDQVIAEMVASTGASQSQAERVVALTQVTGTNQQVLTQLEPLMGNSDLGREGITQLRELLAAVESLHISADQIKIDASIARGLDYYTGTIYETFLGQLPKIGSVCSGGRYDNLTGMFTKQVLPGVGASLGLDRLLAAMQELNLIEPTRTPAPVLIVNFDATRLHDYLRMAARLRQAGIGCEFYPECKKVGQQLGYADKRGVQIALIAGEDEFAANECQVKILAKKEQVTLSMADEMQELISFISEICHGNSTQVK